MMSPMELSINVSCSEEFDPYNSQSSHSPHKLSSYPEDLTMSQTSHVQERLHAFLEESGYFDCVQNVPLLWFMMCRADMYRYVSAYIFHVAIVGHVKRVHPSVLGHLQHVPDLTSCIAGMDLGDEQKDRLARNLRRVWPLDMPPL